MVRGNLIVKSMRVWMRISMDNKINKGMRKNNSRMFSMRLTNKILIRLKMTKIDIKNSNIKQSTFLKKADSKEIEIVPRGIPRGIKISKIKVVKEVKVVNSKKEDEFIYNFMFYLSEFIWHIFYIRMYDN